MKIRIIAFVIFAIGVLGGMIVTLSRGNNPQAGQLCTSAHGQNHTVIIRDDKASPVKTTAKLCDTLSIINLDTVTREIAFGPHENHVAYDGVAEKLLQEGESFTVMLNQPGTYRFHDHVHDEVQGYFTVTK
jgi:plastocyanin